MEIKVNPFISCVFIEIVYNETIKTVMIPRTISQETTSQRISPRMEVYFMDNNYSGMAVGVFELDNLVACFVALDAASKAANVKIQSVERNRLKSGACVKMRGSVSDVNAAMEVALEAAKPTWQKSFLIL